MNSFTKLLSKAALGLFAVTGLFAGSPRAVIIEQATNASCGPCAAQNPTFHAYWKTVDLTKVIPIVYHFNYPGKNDPMYTINPKVMMNRIAANFTTSTGIGVPVCKVDGNWAPIKNGGYEGNVADTAGIATAVNAHLGIMSPYTMTISQTNLTDSIKFEVKVTSDEAVSNKTLRMVVAQTYHYYPNAGNNGEKEFEYIVRDMLPNETGMIINQAAGETKTYNYTVAINKLWWAKGIYGVAFIQDDKTNPASKEILQAVTNYKPTVDKPTTLAAEITNPEQYFKVAKNGTQDFTIKVKNPSDKDAKFYIRLNTTNSKILSSWKNTILKDSIFIKAKATADYACKIITDETVGFQQLCVEAFPISSEFDFMINSEPNYTSFVSQDAKYAYFTFASTSESVLPAFENQKLSAEYVQLPADPNLIAKWADSYNIVFLDFAGTSQGFLTASSALGADLVTSMQTTIKNLIDNGKKVAISAPLETYYASAYGSQDDKDFLNDVLGLNSNSSATSYVNNNQLSTFDIAGSTTNPLGIGINYTGFNSEYSSTGLYQGSATELKITGSDVKSFMFYNNNAKKIAGVNFEKGAAKVVYSSINIDAAASDEDRADYFERILKWFLGSSDVNDNVEATGNTVVYPNPADNVINISGKENIDLNYTLINLLGEVVATGVNTNNKIDINNLNSGCYYIQINGATHKFVKK